MGIGSGIGGFFAVAPEATYGLFVPPNRAFEVESVALKKGKNTAQGGGIAAGRLVNRGARRVVTTADAAGSMKAEVVATGFGLLLAHALGSSAVPVRQGTGPAYIQTHPLGDTLGKSLSMQVGVPDAFGVPHPYSFPGSKIISLQLDCAVDQLLMSSFDFDAQTVTETPAAIVPAYANADPFHWGQAAVKVGAAPGAEAVVQGVTGMSMKIDRPLARKRFYANGTSGLKFEPTTNDEVKITGTITADYVTKADFADRFRDDTPFALVWTFVGPQIATSGFFETFTVACPQCFFDGDTPTLDNYDLVNNGYPFVATYDGTNPAVTVSYTTADAAL